jgi:antitoxin ParD1/3/4
MNVTLNPELEKFVQYKVKSGLYESASEVVNEGVRLLWEREQNRIEELLLDSEKSEESPLTKGDWKELRRRIRNSRK